MSSNTIFFIAEAENLERAERNVINYLENEGFWSYSCMLPVLSGTLVQGHKKLAELLKSWDYKKKADDFLNEAEKYKTDGDFCMYGHFLIYAGELYSQKLSFETPVFNIDSQDYTIPDDDKNWWVVSINLYH